MDESSTTITVAVESWSGFSAKTDTPPVSAPAPQILPVTKGADLPLPFLPSKSRVTVTDLTEDIISLHVIGLSRSDSHSTFSNDEFDLQIPKGSQVQIRFNALDMGNTWTLAW